MIWKTKIVALAAIATIVAFGAGAAHADPYAIRIGWVQTPGHMAPIIEALSKKHPELFKHLGRSYTMQPIHFNGTTPQSRAKVAQTDRDCFATLAMTKEGRWP